VPSSPEAGCGALLAGSVVVDLEPGVVMALGLNARLHGPLHTFTAALLLGWAAGLAGSLAWQGLGLPCPAASPAHAAVGGIIGWLGHVLLDSMLYSDITPLQPLTRENPLYMILGGATLPIDYAVNAALTAWGLIWLLNQSKTP